jgi:phosphatidylserine/phosphatidylglycerophosphate/cardiolipin synthase-like enzyme
MTWAQTSQSSFPPSGREITAFFAPFTNLERIDVEVMSQARRSIDMAAYALTDHAILNALVDAARRSVPVRLYLDEGELRKLSLSPEHPLVRLAAMPNVAIRLKPEGEDLMYLKAYVVDSRVARTGAANFSTSNLKRQDNDLVLITAPDVVRAYEGVFAILWDRGTNKPFTGR